jgi:hypothetical protein
MNDSEKSARAKRKLLIAGILVICAVLLTIADRTILAAEVKIVNDFAAAHAGSGPINGAVESMLLRYKVDPKSITTWRVLTPQKKLLRVEQRLLVSPEFASLEFNHELNQQILPYGGRVAATERSKEKLVTMHILNGGVIIRTMSFAMRPQKITARAAPTREQSSRRTISKGASHR